MELLTTLLSQVSRSFYLTLRVLPAAIRPQIGLAYLLARTTDTIADTGLVPLDQRLTALRQLREAIREAATGGRRPSLQFSRLAERQAAPAERLLLERVEEALEVLRRFQSDDRQRIGDALEIITSGQELDLTRFSGATAQTIVALQQDKELDDYTYRVAGCVGEFWTRMCRAHLFRRDDLDDAFLLSNGVRFGKGLQLVNILRDLPQDLRSGRCYLPLARLEAVGLAPSDLAGAGAWSRLRPLYTEYVGRAEAHLAAGWDYTTALPWRCARVRLACAWPVLIGLKTCAKLRSGNVLESKTPLKIDRGTVQSIMVRSILFYPLPAVWRRFGIPATNVQPKTD